MEDKVEELVHNHKEKNEYMWLQHTQLWDVRKEPNISIHSVEEVSGREIKRHGKQIQWTHNRKITNSM
jgi:hypothetical protein